MQQVPTFEITLFRRPSPLNTCAVRCCYRVFGPWPVGSSAGVRCDRFTLALVRFNCFLSVMCLPTRCYPPNCQISYHLGFTWGSITFCSAIAYLREQAVQRLERFLADWNKYGTIMVYCLQGLSANPSRGACHTNLRQISIIVTILHRCSLCIT